MSESSSQEQRNTNKELIVTKEELAGYRDQLRAVAKNLTERLHGTTAEIQILYGIIDKMNDQL